MAETRIRSLPRLLAELSIMTFCTFLCELSTAKPTSSGDLVANG
jgi:hypothetical protein